MTNKAFKYRIYPGKAQKEFFMKTFGCCRKVWNLMLSDREEAYKKDKATIKPTPAPYKKEHPYLKEVDSLALANVQLHLERAYKRFFEGKGAGKPKFKSRRKSRFSYTTNNQNGTVFLDVPGGMIRLPKAGLVRARVHRTPPQGWKLKSATVSMERDGTFYCSLLYEHKEDAAPAPALIENSIGLDYKSDGLYADSNGNVCGSPKYYRKSLKRLAKQQRRLSRMAGSRKGEKESNNHKKQRIRVAKIHRHAANQRKDFLHRLSAGIANRYGMVCVEDLDLRAMSNKGFGNGKATMDNGYGMFLTMLEYKLRDRGGVLIRVGRWFPSSQTCSVCGHREPSVKDLRVREWTCPSCGTHHDRDHNAAACIKKEGIRIYLANAAGM